MAREMKLGAKPSARVHADKVAMPVQKIILRPYRSDRTPESSRKPPKVSVYAEMSHCRSEAPTPKSFWMAGRAMLTPVMKTLSISCAPQVQHRIMAPRHDRITPMSGYACCPAPVSYAASLWGDEGAVLLLVVVAAPPWPK